MQFSTVTDVLLHALCQWHNILVHVKGGLIRSYCGHFEWRADALRQWLYITELKYEKLNQSPRISD